MTKQWANEVLSTTGRRCCRGATDYSWGNCRGSKMNTVRSAWVVVCTTRMFEGSKNMVGLVPPVLSHNIWSHPQSSVHFPALCLWWSMSSRASSVVSRPHQCFQHDGSLPFGWQLVLLASLLLVAIASFHKSWWPSQPESSVPLYSELF